MKVIHVDEAADNLKAIINEALKGEDVYIYLDHPERRIRLSAGTANSLFWMSDDFDAPMSDFKEYMYEEPIIRLYEDKDRSDLIKLLTQLQRYEQVLDKRLKPAEDRASEAYLNQLLDQCDKNKGAIYVAERDQTVVGMVSTFCDTSDALLTQASDYLYISDLVVSESYRGQNIATHLIQQAEDYARKIGMHYTRLNVLTRNEAALGAYRKSGYEVDLLGMIKLLDETA